MERLLEFDTQLFRWINTHHCAPLDWTMWCVSQHWFFALVLVLLFGLITMRREPRSWWVVGLGIALCFLLSDRISVLCFKDVFCRLRPCHALDEVRMFRTHCGGQYGFVSSHAANVFSLALFFALRYSKATLPPMKNRRRFARIVGGVVFLWALAVCYSRPYLGKHYPGDCLCGGLVGLAVGCFVFWLLEKAIPLTRSQRTNRLS